MDLKRKIALVNMPFSSASSPALGISLLQAALLERGIACEALYLNLDFAEAVGFENYENLAHFAPPQLLAGEWVFSRALFGEHLQRDERYLADLFLRSSYDFTNLNNLLVLKRMRADAEEYLARCVESVDWAQYLLVGFTTTFHQNTASLALARRLKQRYPQMLVAFGGGNCEGEMGRELKRRFAFIDYVFSGEADLTFPDSVAALLLGEEIGQRRGVITANNMETVAAASLIAPVFDMDALPLPCYDDFFAAFEAHGFARYAQPAVPLETSRGCWWGAKMHCTFCGLNAQTMAFRSKSAARALDEIAILEERYGSNFVCVDTILDLKYLNSVFPELIARRKSYRFHFETKVNLKKSQLQLLQRAGVNSLQPGVESLSTSVLRLMKKGCSMLQNVQFLKWCEELGIRPAWNLLYGFPGEDAAEYLTMVELMPAIVHLEPPAFYAPIRLDRYSPYFLDPEQFGMVNVRAHRAYGYIYPFAEEALANLAYYFECEQTGATAAPESVGRLVESARRWQKEPVRGSLQVRREGSAARIMDTRAGFANRQLTLSGMLGELYLYCDEIRSFASILARVKSGGGECSEGELEAALASLVEQRFMLHEGNQYLSLAVLERNEEAEWELDTSERARQSVYAGDEGSGWL